MFSPFVFNLGRLREDDTDLGDCQAVW
jgi:hypothetical protein